MSSWLDIFFFSIFGAALLLCVMGVWFTAIIPGLDRWSKRFFLCYFISFMLCCLSSMLEVIPLYFPISSATFYFILTVESLFLSLPIPMLTVYLLHCRRESMRESKLLRAVAVSWAVYFVLSVSNPFIRCFIIITPDNHSSRGPLYPVEVLPLIVILLFNLAGTFRGIRILSRKVYLSFLVAILPMTLALVVQLFMDVYPLIDIGYVVSTMSMYGFILSDQIEQDLRRQWEIASQQREIAHQRASVIVLQMRPHFIYNTLMGIYSLCNQDPQKARQVTMDFTNYLRKNFNAVASDCTIPFSTELEHTRAYLAVEQAQYEEMLVVELDTAFTQFHLPPLTLQPIAENAVKHGLDLDADPLHVSIRTRHTESGAEITVEDSGSGFDPSDESTPHTTLENIRERLQLMCGGSMRIEPRDGGGTTVTITIPDRNEEE